MGVLQRLDDALDFDEISIPLSVLASFLGWLSLYCILCLTNSKQSYEWHCRVVTGIHAVLISTISFTFGVFYNPWFITNPAGRNNDLEILTLVICLGYFLFDICWCMWFHEDTFMIIHHFLTIACITTSLSMGVSATEVGAAIFGSEVSNPMLQLRYFMREAGHTKNLLYEVNDLLFMLVFIFCRMGIGTFALISYLLHPKPLLVFRVGCVGLYVVSLIFLYGILRFAHRKYTKLYRNWRKYGHIWASEKSNGVKGGHVMTDGGHVIHGDGHGTNGKVSNHSHSD